MSIGARVTRTGKSGRGETRAGRARLTRMALIRLLADCDAPATVWRIRGFSCRANERDGDAD